MRVISPLATLFAASFLSMASLAQVPANPLAAEAPELPEEAAAPPAPVGPQLTREDLEAWLDGLMPYALERGNVAGAVVVFVKDGQILLEKGYGYADVDTKEPVDSETTLFRPGSVSKLFTWTAVMQLVEQGKLDLDGDVNQYLDFKIPPGPEGEMLRIRDLMTHTPGFEESLKELIGEDAGNISSLEKTVKRWTPERIYPAGTMPAYSNYATGLAGYIVERVSGRTFDDYVEQEILTPLGMHNSSFRQPLPEPLFARMAKGYLNATGKPQGYEFINLAPAGSMAATGSDMARFMIAHLHNGAFGEGRILAEETAKKMHGSPLTIIPRMNRMVLGFYESNTNGRRVISHGGDTRYFHSDLHLFIDDGIGLYISMNSTGKEGAAHWIRGSLFRSFADRYLPGPKSAGKVEVSVAKDHAAKIAGSYVLSRRADSSLLSVLGLLNPVKVIANEDGTISIPIAVLNGLNGEPVKWREIEPFVWTDPDGNERLAAEVVDGRVTRFSAGELSSIIYFQRAPARAAGWVAPATIAAVAALALTVLLWPVAALVRRRYRKVLPYAGQEARAYRLVRIGALASLLAIGAWVATIVAMLKDLSLLSPKLDWWLVVLHVFGTIAVFAGVALALWHLLVVWKAPKRPLGKIWAVVLVLATAVCAWVAIAYHLVGISTNY